MMTISSQRYIDPAVVAAKQAAKDYTAYYVTVEVDGETYAVITDGHHSIGAAKADGVGADLRPASAELQSEADAFVGGGLAYLEAHQADADWYDVTDGRNVW